MNWESWLSHSTLLRYTSSKTERYRTIHRSKIEYRHIQRSRSLIILSFISFVRSYRSRPFSLSYWSFFSAFVIDQIQIFFDNLKFIWRIRIISSFEIINDFTDIWLSLRFHWLLTENLHIFATELSSTIFKFKIKHRYMGEFDKKILE